MVGEWIGMATLLLLRRLYTLVSELPGSVRDERSRDEKWFLIRPYPNALRWTRAGRWASIRRARPTHGDSAGQSCQAENAGRALDQA
jgi:hypothetical protein